MGAVAASMETEFVPESGHEHVRVLHVYSGNMFGGVEWFLRTLAEHGGHAPWMTSEFALCFITRSSLIHYGERHFISLSGSRIG